MSRGPPGAPLSKATLYGPMHPLRGEQLRSVGLPRSQPAAAPEFSSQSCVSSRHLRPTLISRGLSSRSTQSAVCGSSDSYRHQSISLKDKVSASKQLSRGFGGVNQHGVPPVAAAYHSRGLRRPAHVKHSKMLAEGRQIKTHLRCDHADEGPIWGAGDAKRANDVVESDPNDDAILRRAKIDKKIDRICVQAAKRRRLGEGEGQQPCVFTPGPVRHTKVQTDGLQVKTRLRCDHGSGPLNQPGTSKQQQHFDRPHLPNSGDRRYSSHRPHLLTDSSSDSDSDRDHYQSSSDGGIGLRRRRVVLRSTRMVPRGEEDGGRNVYSVVDDGSNDSDYDGIIDVNGSNQRHEDDDPLRAHSSHSNKHFPNSSDLIGGASSSESSKRKNVRFTDGRIDNLDCKYCDEDDRERPVYPLDDRYRLGGNFDIYPPGSCSAGPSGERFDEPCPGCERKKACAESSVCNVNRGSRDYKSMCQFCRKVMNVADLSIACMGCRRSCKCGCGCGASPPKRRRNDCRNMPGVGGRSCWRDHRVSENVPPRESSFERSKNRIQRQARAALAEFNEPARAGGGSVGTGVHHSRLHQFENPSYSDDCRRSDEEQDASCSRYRVGGVSARHQHHSRDDLTQSDSCLQRFNTLRTSQKPGTCSGRGRFEGLARRTSTDRPRASILKTGKLRSAATPGSSRDVLDGSANVADPSQLGKRRKSGGHHGLNMKHKKTSTAAASVKRDPKNSLALDDHL